MRLSLTVLVALCGLPALAQTTNLVTIHGSDGMLCHLRKVGGSNIQANFVCTQINSSPGVKASIPQPVLGSTSVITVSQGQVLCLIAENTTSTPVSFGSVGEAPANGIAWSCTDGTGNMLNGSAVWP